MQLQLRLRSIATDVIFWYVILVNDAQLFRCGFPRFLRVNREVPNTLSCEDSIGVDQQARSPCASGNRDNQPITGLWDIAEITCSLRRRHSARPNRGQLKYPSIAVV